MAVRIDLESVRRKTGGRVHLTPHVPDAGPVVTLCGQTFAEGTYEASAAEADCRNCLRRRDDPARVSSAFFQSDVGAELLQRSLEQARARQRDPGSPGNRGGGVRISRGGGEQPAPPARERRAAEPPPREAPKPAPPRVVPRPQPEVRELRSRTSLRQTFPDVYLSPDGVIVRVADGGVEHVTFNGAVDVRQRDGVLTLRIGDVVLEFDVG